MKEEFSFNERSSREQCSRRGTNHYKTTIEPTVAYLLKYYSNVTTRLFRVEEIEKKTEPICAEENRDSMVNELPALHRPVSG